ncbi:glycosyltransferase family 2 protein [Qipengyuania sp. CAU 1752]
MTKLVIQIPCFNEADHIADTVRALPRHIDGIDSIEILVIDDGSRDGTAQAAAAAGVHHIVHHRGNRGLAAAFQSGVDRALCEGADIIVNTDADGQYEGEDVAALVRPLIDLDADIVVGDRGVRENAHFGPVKKRLQVIGSMVVRRLSRTEIADAVSGFRAFTREAAQRIFITTDFSYTTDMLIQAGRKRMRIVSVPIRTNAAARPSRLFGSIPSFIAHTGVTIARAYTTYNPLRVFLLTGALIAFIGAIPIVRFLFLYFSGDGDGHVQSLVIGGSLLVLGVLVSILGILGDLIAANRKLLEANLRHVRRLEERIDLLSPETGGSQPKKDTDKTVARRRG